MIICQNCGRENPDDPTFCIQCGKFLRWDDSIRANTALEDESAAAVGVTLAPYDLRVPAGGEVEAELQVRNKGRMVDYFTVVVRGPTAAWVEVDPVTLRLMPNHEGTVRVRFRPPRSPGVPAGRSPFGVQVTSRADPEVVGLVDANLDPSLFNAVQIELTPRTSEGRRVGEHQLTVVNPGTRDCRPASGSTIRTRSSGQPCGCASSTSRRTKRQARRCAAVKSSTATTRRAFRCSCLSGVMMVARPNPRKAPSGAGAATAKLAWWVISSRSLERSLAGLRALTRGL